MSSDIESLVVKFLTNSATADDLDILGEWILAPANKEIFKEYVEVHYSIFHSMKEPNSQEVLQKLLSTIRREKSLVYQLRNHSIYKYAAVVLICLALISGYFLSINTSNEEIKEEKVIVNQNTVIKTGTDRAILTLEDGSQLALGKGDTLNKQHIKSNGRELIYKNKKSDRKEIKYNYLTIPRGGQFTIELSDGTKVWLNSESQLKYPVSFVNGTTRKVDLVYGEAFFDVSPSKNHGGSKFSVVNQSQEVEVLGTEFNIKAYLGEPNVYTTLVEGSVSVHSGNVIKKLKPSQQLNLSKENNYSTVSMVDVYNEIAWKEGVFSFDGKALKDMMVVLSRWYDTEVTFKNKAIEDEEFVGVLRKNQDIEEILTAIKNFGIIKNFEIYEKTVIIE